MVVRPKDHTGTVGTLAGAPEHTPKVAAEGGHNVSANKAEQSSPPLTDSVATDRKADPSPASSPVAPNQVAPQAPSSQPGGVKRTSGAARVKKTKGRSKAPEFKENLTPEQQKAKNRKKWLIRGAIATAGLIGFGVAGIVTGGTGWFIGAAVWFGASFILSAKHPDLSI